MSFATIMQRVRPLVQPQAQPQMSPPMSMGAQMPTGGPSQANTGFMTPAPGSGGPGLYGALQMLRNPANQAQMRARQMAQLLMTPGG